MKSLIARFDAWLDAGGKLAEFVGTALLATGFAVILAVFKILEG